MRKSPLLAALLAATLSLISTSALAVPLITEFMTNNNTGILDEDSTHQDWIEIYNPDATPLDLGGYHLTDDVTLPAKWTVPAGYSIPATSYAVIFASSKNRTTLGSPLHTNFSLTSNGEYLGLYNPAGTLIQEFAPSFPVQSADVSYGLLNPLAGSALAYFEIPTPGAVNNAGSAPAGPVAFSVSSRTFNQGASFPLTLSVTSPTATIRYTQNRAVPINVQGTTGDFTADATTDILTMTAHGLKDRDEVQVNTTGTLPGGLGLSLNYYVLYLTANTFKLATEPGGAAVDLTSVGTGVNSVRRHAAYFTATAGTPGVLTTAYHKFYDRDAVQVTSTGTLPGGLTAGTTYYVVLVDLNNYRLATTLGGAGITLTDPGTGTHTIRRQISPLYAGALTVNYSQRVRARAFETTRPDGPTISESYIMLDPTAQAFTSNLPIMILHSWGSGHPSITPASGTNPEDTKQAVWFVFEPKLEGTALVARMTNLPDLATPAYFERRGSSTFGIEKYSMSMGAYDESNSGKNVSPMGFASNDDFVLNSPYAFDRSLMHNDLIYRLSSEAGRWAPHTRHVEVFQSVLNDVAASGVTPAYGVVGGAITTGSIDSADYYGVYSFQDKISRGTNRVDVEKLETTDNTAPNVQGGYVFKIDRLDAGDGGINAGGHNFPFVQPKEYTSYPSHLPVITTQQKTYLQTYINSMYAACTSTSYADPSSGYAAWLDVPAAIDHHIFSMAPKSADAFRLSGYWHKSRYGKLVMGPIFDFDRAMGSTDGRDLNPLTWRGDNGDLGTDYFHNASIYTPNYFQYMFQDPNFWQAWIDRLDELRHGVLSTAHVHAIIDEYTDLLDAPGATGTTSTPARRHFTRWSSFSITPRGSSASTTGTDGTFRGEAKWLKNWWGKAGTVTANGRLDFMDGQFARPPVVSPALPAQTPNPVSVSLTSPTLATSGAKIYYTINGTDPRATILPEITTIVSNFVTQTTPVKAIVPTSVINTAIGNTWRGANEPFNDSTWQASVTSPAPAYTGVGYDPGPGTVDFRPYIGLTVAMQNVNTSCYIRYAFTVPVGGLNGINLLRLKMRYDDGFQAFLNGTPLAAAIAPATASLAWNSTSLSAGTHDDNLAIIQETTDVLLSTLPANTLHEGVNILAIHGLNANLTSSDLLMQPELQGGFKAPAVTAEFTAGATEYTGALSFTQPTKIFARTRHPNAPSDPPATSAEGVGVVPNGSRFSAPLVLYVFPGAVSASQASIQISEVLYHAAAPTTEEINLGYASANDFEFIRLTNIGPSPVDLTGIYFSTGIDFTAAAGLQNFLPAGASVVVVENIAAFTYRYGTSFTILGQYSGDLDNSGEHITLNDKTGAIISSFVYDDKAPWPTAADNGFSLIYKGGNQTLPASWTSSVDPGGTAAITYAKWQARYYTPTQRPGQPMTQDDDHDGLNNLGEYAFATDPYLPGSLEQTRGVALPGDPPSLAVRRRKGTTDLTWIFETSTDLVPVNWNAASGERSFVVDNGDGTETITYQPPSIVGVTKLFMRVRVTNP